MNDQEMWCYIHATTWFGAAEPVSGRDDFVDIILRSIIIIGA